MNPQTFPDGQAPWQTQGQSFPDGQAPWQSGGSTATATPPSQPGFIQSAAQSIAKPFLQFARLPAGLLAEGAGALTGNKTLEENGAAAASNQPYDFGYLGKVNAAGYDANGKPLSAANATGQAVGAGLQVAPWFVGAGEAEPLVEGAAAAAKPAVSAGSRILQGIGAGAGIGASQGAGSELQSESESGNGISPLNVAGAGLVGAGAGAASGGLLSAAGALGAHLLDSIAAKGPGGALDAQAANLKTLTNAIRDSKTNPVQTITDMMTSSKTPLLTVDNGKVVTTALEDALNGAQRDVNDRAAAIVKNMPGTVNLGEVQSTIEDAIRNNSTLRGSGSVTRALTKLQGMFDDYVTSYGPKAAEGEEALTLKDVNVPYSALNEIRTSMNKYFDPDTVDLEKTIADTMRQYLYDAKSGSSELQTLMQKYGALSDAQNFAQKLSNTAVKGGRLGKYLADLAGVGVGSTLGASFGPVGPAIGAVGGGFVTDKAMNALQSGYFKPSAFAAPASTLSRFLGKPAIQGAGALAKQAAIRTAISPFIPQQQPQ